MNFAEERRVVVRFRGKSALGAFCLGSLDGLTAVIKFTGKLEVYAEVLPVRWINGGYVDLLYGESVQMEQAPEEQSLSDKLINLKVGNTR